MLVGLQREWAGRHLAGLRTFVLITLFGFTGSLGEHADWLAAAGTAAATSTRAARAARVPRLSEQHSSGPTPPRQLCRGTPAQ
jgi:hypothetical protein